MLIAIALTLAGAAVVIGGALLASGSSGPTPSDRWIISGPHSYH